MRREPRRKEGAGAHVGHVLPSPLMPMRLHINIDHVATLRNARGTAYPDPIEAALACLRAGAQGITAHLREDRRHIRDADVERLRQAVASTFNLEMAATDEMVAIACRVKPTVVTLVPERREERTTEGGLEVARAQDSLAGFVRALQDASIRVSLFIAPDPEQVQASRSLGVDQIELHTGEYAHAVGDAHRESHELGRLGAAAKLARELGLEVAAGHGLTVSNVPALMHHAREIDELNIGHSVIADAVFVGLEAAVARMLAAMAEGRNRG